jgi:hypothetical protein
MMRSAKRPHKGQALVEYAILLCGIALISLAAVALIGGKTSDLLGTMAVFLPSAHADDNGPIFNGKLIELTKNTNGAIVVDVSSATGVTQAGPRLANTLGVDLSNVIIEP